MHCKFEQLGIKNDVIHPQDLDERGKGVKNDFLDAAMFQILRPEGGTGQSLTTVDRCRFTARYFARTI